jgi:hypothetical protein
MEKTWTCRELPVLRTLVEKFDDPDTYDVRITALPDLTGLAETEVKQALRALFSAEPPYLEGKAFAETTYPVIISSVTERARRAVGQWPASDQGPDVLIAALQGAAETEPDEAKRSGLRKTAEFLAGAGREVLFRVMTQVGSQEATQHIPHHL